MGALKTKAKIGFSFSTLLTIFLEIKFLILTRSDWACVYPVPPWDWVPTAPARLPLHANRNVCRFVFFVKILGVFISERLHKNLRCRNTLQNYVFDIIKLFAHIHIYLYVCIYLFMLAIAGQTGIIGYPGANIGKKLIFIFLNLFSS